MSEALSTRGHGYGLEADCRSLATSRTWLVRGTVRELCFFIGVGPEWEAWLREPYKNVSLMPGEPAALRPTERSRSICRTARLSGCCRVARGKRQKKKDVRL